MDAINQKEYLKKYLGIGRLPGEKKKKKKSKGISNRVQIIDDDAEVNITSHVIEEDLQANEDAPQIVAIIDERPPSLRVDDKTKNPLWQPIGSVDTINSPEQKQTITAFKIAAKTNEKQFAYPIDRPPPKKKINIPTLQDSRHEDISPPRITVGADDVNNKSFESDDILSLKRSNKDDISPPRKNRDDDASPPRRSRHEDMSPPRRRKNNDMSPPRKSRHDDKSSSRRSTSKYDNSPRRSRRENLSPSRRKKVSSLRKNAHSSSPDNSPPRKQVHLNKEEKRKRENSIEKQINKMDKTLDGKTAGLQNAQELVEETQQLRERENQLFKNLSKEQTGENAATVFRNRKSGKIRNLEEEGERQKKKQEKEEKNKEKYSRWGRGLVQVENRDQKIQEELYEMSKPLARYADDEDLEKFLKEQEREGDPMLQYIRNKKRKKAADAGVVMKPEFEGNFMPNRFGIKPGHRWDGVDRSNGYEKRWFEVQNAKTAQQEDVYKWSTEDM